jgi:hypothetical protein
MLLVDLVDQPKQSEYHLCGPRSRGDDDDRRVEGSDKAMQK